MDWLRFPVFFPRSGHFRGVRRACHVGQRAAHQRPHATRRLDSSIANSAEWLGAPWRSPKGDAPARRPADRDVRVMAAGMRHRDLLAEPLALGLRPERQLVAVGDRQCVQVRAQRHHRSGLAAAHTALMPPGPKRRGALAGAQRQGRGADRDRRGPAATGSTPVERGPAGRGRNRAAARRGAACCAWLSVRSRWSNCCRMRCSISVAAGPAWCSNCRSSAASTSRGSGTAATSTSRSSANSIRPSRTASTGGPARLPARPPPGDWSGCASRAGCRTCMSRC